MSAMLCRCPRAINQLLQGNESSGWSACSAEFALTGFTATIFLDPVDGYKVYAASMEGLTRGQLAQRVGINLETVRFYEKEGLLPPASRTASGYRQFAEGTVGRLEFVKRAKDLGFSLSEIRELLVLQDGGADCCAEIRDRLRSKLIAVLAKKAELERLEEHLRSALRKCNRQLKKAGSRRSEQCPVLKQMAGSA